MQTLVGVRNKLFESQLGDEPDARQKADCLPQGDLRKLLSVWQGG